MVVGYFESEDFGVSSLSNENWPGKGRWPNTFTKLFGFRFNSLFGLSVSNRMELTQLISSPFSLLNNEKCQRFPAHSMSLDIWPINVSIMFGVSCMFFLMFHTLGLGCASWNMPIIINHPLTFPHVPWCSKIKPFGSLLLFP